MTIIQWDQEIFKIIIEMKWMILLMKIMVINTEVLKHNPHDYNAC